MNRSFITKFVALALGLSPALFASPSIDPLMRDTPHLRVIGDKKLKERLDTLAALSEATWQRLSEVTGYSPNERITLALHDEDDYSNGWAYAPKSWVNVWLPPILFDLRGGTDWERNVIAHEMGHIFTLRALGYDGTFTSMGADYHENKRNHTVDANISWSFNQCEAWLAEGLAQISAQLCGADHWDAHRDMLERIAWQDGKLLTDGLLRTFWGDGRESEQIYNQGYSFLRFTLSKGNLDFVELLREGRRTSLREAIEKSLGLSFAKCLKAWELDVAARQSAMRLPAPSAQSLLAPAPAARWTVQSSPVGIGPRRWLLSSHENDYALMDLWEVTSTGSRKIANNFQGRLHLSPDGAHLLAIREDIWSGRAQINDLWEYDTKQETWQQRTSRGRIFDGTWYRNGFAVIRRDSGRSRIECIDTNGIRTTCLPDPTAVAVQIASSPDQRLWVTTMGETGYQIAEWKEAAGWTPISGFANQSKDPTWAQGMLWFSALIDGHWRAAQQDSTGAIRIVAEATGGMFAPYPVNDSILVSQYTSQGYVAQALVLQTRQPTNSTAYAPSPAEFQVPTLELGKGIRRLPFTPPNLVAWGLAIGYSTNDDTIGRFKVGDAMILGGGLSLGGVRDDFQIGVDALSSFTSSKAAPGKAISVSISTERFAPTLSASGWLQSQPLMARRPSSDTNDGFFTSDTLLPVVTSQGLSLEAFLRLSLSSYGFAFWQYQAQGLGTTSSNGSSITLRSSTTTGLGLGWQDFSPGRLGPWQGLGWQVSTARIGSYASPWIGTGIDYWSLSGHLQAVTNIQRRVILDWSSQGGWMIPDRYIPAQGSGESNLQLVVPLSSEAITLVARGSRRITLINPSFSIMTSMELEPRSVPVGSAILRDGFTATQLSVAGKPYAMQSPFPRDVRAGGRAGVALASNAITLGNRLSQWRFGVDLPWEETSSLDRVRWHISVAL